MKKVILLFLFLHLIAGTTKAQTLVDTNKVWHVVSCLNFGPCGTTVFRFGADTTIGTFLYKKMEINQDSGGFLISYPIAGREDTSAKQVFFYNGTTDYLVYDFSLNQGDTFTTNNGSCSYQMIVDSTDTIILLNGEHRKRLFLSYISSEVWIEGIGSLYGLTFEAVYYCSVDIYPELNCFSENNILKYQNPFYTNCFFNSVGIEEYSFNRKFSLRPNPFHDISILSFENPHRERSNLRIVSMDGRLVRQYSNITENEITIKRNGLNDGIYFFQLITEKGIISNGRIVIQ